MTTRDGDDLVSRLRDVIRYDKKTGHLIWLKDNGRAKAGHPAGWKKSNGYIEVGVLGARYKAHRLVWLLTYGCLPTVDIDHINGDRADNRLANLRLASRRPAKKFENARSRSRRACVCATEETSLIQSKSARRSASSRH